MSDLANNPLTAYDLRTGTAHTITGEERRIETEIRETPNGYAVTTRVIDPVTGDVLGGERTETRTLDDAYSWAHATEFKYGAPQMDSAARADFDDSEDPIVAGPKHEPPKSTDDQTRRAAEPPKDEESDEGKGSITTAADVGHYLDNQVDRAVKSARNSLEDFVQNNGSGLAVFGATVASTVLELGADSLKNVWGLSHLGEGLAEGTWSGAAKDAMLVVGALIPGAKLLKKAGQAKGLMGLLRREASAGSQLAAAGTMSGSVKWGARDLKAWGNHQITAGGRTTQYQRLTAERLMSAETIFSGKTRFQRYQELTGKLMGDQSVRAKLLSDLQRMKDKTIFSYPSDMKARLVKDAFGFFDGSSGAIHITRFAGPRAALRIFAHEERHLASLIEMRRKVGDEAKALAKWGEKYKSPVGRWLEETRAQVAAERGVSYLRSAAENDAALRQAVRNFGLGYSNNPGERAAMDAWTKSVIGQLRTLYMLRREGVELPLAWKIVTGR